MGQNLVGQKLGNENLGSQNFGSKDIRTCRVLREASVRGAGDGTQKQLDVLQDARYEKAPIRRSGLLTLALILQRLFGCGGQI